MSAVRRLPECTQGRESQRRARSTRFRRNPGRTTSRTTLVLPVRGDDVSPPSNGRGDASDGTFTSHVDVDRDSCVVCVAGELDLSSAARAMQSCLDVGRPVVSVDMRGLTFMDCGGYRGLVGARVELERRGGSLTLTGAVGEPARLLDLLARRHVA